MINYLKKNMVLLFNDILLFNLFENDYLSLSIIFEVEHHWFKEILDTLN